MHCSHHPACPGCPLLALDGPAQLATKRKRLAAALAQYPHLPPAPPVRAALHSDGYRHRVKLPVAQVHGGVAIGLYARDGRRVLHTPDCPVAHPHLRDVLAALSRALIGHSEVHAIDARVSAATGEVQLILAVDGGSLRGGRRLAEAWLRELPHVRSIAISTADPARKRVMGRKPIVVAGAPWLEEAIGPTRYRLLPGAFFQVDPRNAVQLHDLVRGAVGDAATVLDLYAGVGAYALALAPGRRRVVAVEEVSQAAAAARAMAPANVEVISAPVESLSLDDAFDAAILNPARDGSDPGSLARLARAAPRAVYVSCGPETLARDLDVLAAHGLRVRDIAAVDLFPHTAEVEAIVWLERGPSLRTWPVPGGVAGGPWFGQPSGAVGRPTEAIALVIGDPGSHGRIGATAWRRLGVVATHALLHLQLAGPFDEALRQLARRGHPTAGRDPRTARFFADKAGLQRPFEHILAAGKARAPLHGDLVQALATLGAPPELQRSAGAARPL